MYGSFQQPVFSIETKISDLGSQFQRKQNFEKTVKKSKFLIFLRTIKLFVEKNAAAAYAWELFVTFSIRRIRNPRFVNVVFDKIQKNSENRLKIKNLSFLSAINFFVKKSA